jgi:proteasome activator subunit 4
MLEYGDSRDSYFSQAEQYTAECNVTRHYAGQKEWPRAVFVRRARLYHSARLRWNSIDRRRTPLEEQLVDDLVEWSMWHYATGSCFMATLDCR